MKAWFHKALERSTGFVRLCSSRFLILALALAVATGTWLSTPIAAENVALTTAAAEDTAEEDTAAVPAAVERCTFKLLENNMETMEAATVSLTTVYSGEPLPMSSVTVSADGEVAVLCMENGKTVNEAVTASGIKLGEEDYFSVSGDALVQDGMTVTVIRVAYTEYTKTYSVAYTTEVQHTSTLRQGVSTVKQAGVTGVKTVTYRDRTENGKKISTVKVKETVTKQPVKKIVLKGTKVGKVVSDAPFDIALNGTAQPLNYKKKLTGKATAYTSDRGDSGLYTSCGYRTNVGIVAVDPKVIPYGTKLWIVSADGKYVYGYAIAGDTGGGVRSGKLLVDLYFNTYGECLQFGRRTMNVYIL